MSKGTRKREAAAVRRAEEAIRRQEQSKKVRRNRILVVCTAVVAVAAITVGAFAIAHHKKWSDPDYRLHNTVVAKSENYTVTQAMLTYFMSSTVSGFVAENEEHIEEIGLDTDRSLKDQTCYFSEDMTWFDYFADAAKDTVKWLLSFAEQARADGLSLTDEDKKAIDNTLATVVPSRFGEHLTKTDIRACLELYYMADKQESKVQETLTVSDADINAYADAHNKELLKADVACYVLPYGKTYYYADKAAAEAVADKLAAASDEEFKNLLKQELVSRGIYTEASADAGYEEYCVSKGYTYAENDGFSEWLFGGNTKSGDAYQFEQTDAIAVVRCLSDPVRNTDRWVDVRHILLTKEKYGTDEEAEKKADEVLAEWKAGAATEDSFGELAKTYSEDGNAATGGLYTGVYPGQMVATFNDWCFDAARQTGDTGVVQTTYGYHVMYFVGRDGERWYALSQEACLDEAYKATKQQYIDRYVLEMNDGAVQEISL